MATQGGASDEPQLGGLIDRGRFDEWITAQKLPGSGPAMSFTKLKGGLQNVVFLVEREGASFVLRRPPARIRDGQNETMLREARILSALENTPVPAPAVFAVCEDVSVIGAAFYLMEPLEGFARSGELPGNYAADPSWRRAMGEELVRAAAALGSVDHHAVGLADLGKPENWHERQIERWRSQLYGYASVTPAYDAGELPHFDEIGRWLAANLPEDRRIGIVHGDLQFPNVMFSLEAPRITGILDWELASLGDPMLDLGWILTSWWEEDDPEGKSPMVKPWDGFLSRAELIDLYCDLSGRDRRSVRWFFVLACYKLACLLQGTVAASKADKVPENVGASVHAYSVWLTTKARQIIAG